MGTVKVTMKVTLLIFGVAALYTHGVASQCTPQFSGISVVLNETAPVKMGQIVKKWEDGSSDEMEPRIASSAQKSHMGSFSVSFNGETGFINMVAPKRRMRSVDLPWSSPQEGDLVVEAGESRNKLVFVNSEGHFTDLGFVDGSDFEAPIAIMALGPLNTHGAFVISAHRGEAKAMKPMEDLPPMHEEPENPMMNNMTVRVRMVNFDATGVTSTTDVSSATIHAGLRCEDTILTNNGDEIAAHLLCRWEEKREDYKRRLHEHGMPPKNYTWLANGEEVISNIPYEGGFGSQGAQLLTFTPAGDVSSDFFHCPFAEVSLKPSSAYAEGGNWKGALPIMVWFYPVDTYSLEEMERIGHQPFSCPAMGIAAEDVTVHYHADGDYETAEPLHGLAHIGSTAEGTAVDFMPLPVFGTDTSNITDIVFAADGTVAVGFSLYAPVDDNLQGEIHLPVGHGMVVLPIPAEFTDNYPLENLQHEHKHVSGGGVVTGTYAPDASGMMKFEPLHAAMFSVGGYAPEGADDTEYYWYGDNHFVLSIPLQPHAMVNITTVHFTEGVASGVSFQRLDFDTGYKAGKPDCMTGPQMAVIDFDASLDIAEIFTAKPFLDLHMGCGHDLPAAMEGDMVFFPRLSFFPRPLHAAGADPVWGVYAGSVYGRSVLQTHSNDNTYILPYDVHGGMTFAFGVIPAGCAAASPAARDTSELPDDYDLLVGPRFNYHEGDDYGPDMEYETVTYKVRVSNYYELVGSAADGGSFAFHRLLAGLTTWTHCSSDRGLPGFNTDLQLTVESSEVYDEDGGSIYFYGSFVMPMPRYHDRHISHDFYLAFRYNSCLSLQQTANAMHATLHNTLFDEFVARVGEDPHQRCEWTSGPGWCPEHFHWEPK